MIEKFKVLCRVKKLREDSKFRILRKARAAVVTAEENVRRQTKIVAESKDSLPSRETAIYDEIMQQIVDIDDIDETKDKVIQLQLGHQKLEDRKEQAIQTEIRLNKELDEARLAYQMAQRNRDKFENMKNDLEIEAAALAEYQEEAEIEDLFAKGIPEPS